MIEIARAVLLVMAVFWVLLAASIVAVDAYYAVRDWSRCRRARRLADPLERLFALPAYDPDRPERSERWAA